MTNYERIKEMNIVQLSHFLCDSMDLVESHDKYSCDICPMWGKCHAEELEGNGWLNWLKEEAR